MPSKRKLLSSSKFYLILDTQVNTYTELFDIAKQAINSGVDILQLRDKDGKARQILDFSKRVITLKKNKVLYFINDRADLTFIAKADGVHLGQSDLAIKEAKRILSSHFLIGCSCQNLIHANKAVKEGADYIGFGSIFKTLTKPERCPMDLRRLSEIYKKIKIPIFSIGGITRSNISVLRSLGADRFAVCRAVCKAKNVKKACREFEKLIKI